MKKVEIGIVDDHKLVLKSITFMLESFNDFSVVVEASNGLDLQKKLNDAKTLPVIMLVDVSMPGMDGILTAGWLNKTYPCIKVVALSMNESPVSIISMLKAGCCSYLSKDMHPNELIKALHEIISHGYYNADIKNINYRRLLLAEKEMQELNLSENEKKFLQLSCSDMTYKLIASHMKCSERTVDFFRESLFNKFHVQSRVGMVLEGIRKGIISIEP